MLAEHTVTFRKLYKRAIAARVSQTHRSRLVRKPALTHS